MKKHGIILPIDAIFSKCFTILAILLNLIFAEKLF